MAYEQASQIISDAAVELGLVSADIADPFASTDANVIQLCRLLTSLGREIVRDHQWPYLTKSYTFNTVNGTQTYALPADFDRMLDQSNWNRTTRFPLGGPVSGQSWEYLQAISSAQTLLVLFKETQGLVYLYPTPTSAQTVAYQYLSSYWVMPNGQSSPTASRVSANDDTLVLDSLMMMRGLKAKWQAAKGFDNSANLAEYLDSLEKAKHASASAPVLTLSGSGSIFPLIDDRNIPYTGFGS